MPVCANVTAIEQELFKKKFQQMLNAIQQDMCLLVFFFLQTYFLLGAWHKK